MQPCSTVTKLWSEDKLVRMRESFVFELVASFISSDLKRCLGLFQPTQFVLMIKQEEITPFLFLA